MSIPTPVYNPPFNITRASHSVLTVKDLSVSRSFYVDLLGFIVSDEDKETIFLRGVAEACHHSLVLKRARGEPQAERVGMRVFTEEDLEKAKAFFHRSGLPAKWVEVAHQGRTLHVSDTSGAPIELCATMDLKPRLVVAFEHHHGAVPQRLDHFQLLVPDVRKACEFWMSMGFRLSEYISPDGTDELLFVFLQRKGNPHDIVFAPGAGPRLHHAAFGIPESYHFFYVCDLAAEAVQHPLSGDGYRERARALGRELRHAATMAAAGAAAMVRRGKPLCECRAARARPQRRSAEPGEIHRRRNAVKPRDVMAGPRSSH
jgi:catechol 2,3-dioxygenase